MITTKANAVVVQYLQTMLTDDNVRIEDFFTKPFGPRDDKSLPLEDSNLM